MGDRVNVRSRKQRFLFPPIKLPIFICIMRTVDGIILPSFVIKRTRNAPPGPFSSRLRNELNDSKQTFQFNAIMPYPEQLIFMLPRCSGFRFTIGFVFGGCRKNRSLSDAFDLLKRLQERRRDQGGDVNGILGKTKKNKNCYIYVHNIRIKVKG